MALQLRTLVVLVPAARQKLTTVYSFYLTVSVALIWSPWVLHNVVKQSHLKNKNNSKNSHYVLNSNFLKLSGLHFQFLIAVFWVIKTRKQANTPREKIYTDLNILPLKPFLSVWNEGFHG